MDEIYECPQCNQKITIPSEIDRAAQLELAELVHMGRRIDAIAVIIAKYKLGLLDSKIMMTHITVQKDICVRCGSKLLEDGVTNCASCSALNLNWQ